MAEQQHRTRLSILHSRHVVICDVCNVVGRPDGEEYEGDAQAIADRHEMVGGVYVPDGAVSGPVACTTCGMRADADPEFHAERYGHWPTVRCAECRSNVEFGGPELCTRCDEHAAITDPAEREQILARLQYSSGEYDAPEASA